MTYEHVCRVFVSENNAYIFVGMYGDGSIESMGVHANYTRNPFKTVPYLMLVLLRGPPLFIQNRHSRPGVLSNHYSTI